MLIMSTTADTVILIPTYNNAGTLADVVRRALHQGLPVMVVDDGSTDGTAEVLSGLQSAVRVQIKAFSCPDHLESAEREVFPSAKKIADATGNTSLSDNETSDAAEKASLSDNETSDASENTSLSDNEDISADDKASLTDNGVSAVRGAFSVASANISAEENAPLAVVRHVVNQGKGVALKTGFQEALRLGYSYAVTLDADGQHHPEDVPVLLAQKGEKTLVVGSRSIRGKDGRSSFANKFSNFWFTLYTWIKLPDTQTGYRLYPLKNLPSLRLLSARYEAELTLLVFSAWKGLKLVPVPVQVEYPEDRVTHFRPGKDFTRISILNTLLLFVALFYGYPRTLLRKLLCLFRKNS